MLVEMAYMTKRVPLGMVENVLVKIDKFLFLSDFMVIDMLNTRNETMILGRPFLATIYVKTDVFNKKHFRNKGDMVTFNMEKKIHNIATHVGKEQSSKKARMLKPDMNTLSAHFCKPVKQNCNGILKKKHKWGGLSFPDFLLVRHGDAHDNNVIWDSLRRQNRRVPYDQRNKKPQHQRIFYPPILDNNHFRHFLVTLENLFLMDDERMWAPDRVVALTLGFAITKPETANEFAIKDTENEAVRLIMFPLSLTGEAKSWLNELNEGTIETWDELRATFISQFFPPAPFDRLLRESKLSLNMKMNP
uniref:Retrotransposon gag domain-containing protein n=1 Tax=Tanacetum cinerariifolium TaxID=118510 RepID=A0A6L2P4Y3_TANCI|nr:hypothetical protein [Tanacetum cinerariifolium]